MLSKVISISPDTVSGAPCFMGTRVPIKSLFDYLEAGDGLDEFLDQFPSVSRAAAIQLLEDSRLAVVTA
jgi:uncharacterized protein (DUF433 family)